ncbi:MULTISPECIES: hypothetical protein [Enterobacteriaceae]|uniref:hypothetical protein n=1 Tax=Enterobacteriaceae TaxID=543 RepID=UPI0008632E2B|nr:hypothetical protein [Klebsiella sp. LTGPAF-6F]AOV10003.1 hypothetical protein BJF97_02730 [Klebsiella sp. LTGPAF-6F]
MTLKEINDIAVVLLYSVMPIAFAVVASGIIIFIGWYITTLRYRRIIRIAIQNNKLKNEDLHIFLNKKYISYSSLNLVLKNLFEEELKKTRGDNHTNTLRDIINWYEEQEGLIELPKDIRANLEVIRKQTPESEHQINQLAASLKDLFITRQRRENRLRRFSYISGGVGIIGVLYGVIQSML